MTTSPPRADPRERAGEVARVLRADAADVDERATFPHRGLDALRGSGLLALLVPEAFGGAGAGPREFVAVAGELAAGCLSTGLIWAMHSQQVAGLVDGADPSLRDRLLPRIGRGEVYLASVTSERGKGGHLLSAQQPLERTATGFHLDRDAPIVTGVRAADGFLVTMRSAPEAPASSVSLVYVAREQAQVTVSGRWDPMGMRGTESLAARIVADVPADQVIGPAGFRAMALHPFVTVGHLGWAACWLGAARGTFREVVALLRAPATRAQFPLDDELFRVRLARVRLLLDTAGAYLSQVVREVEEVGAGAADPEDPAFQLHVNGLKVAVSELAFDAVNQLVEAVGLRHGYLRGTSPPLERVLRDLRSASLNYANDRLLVANGWLAVLDREVRLP